MLLASGVLKVRVEDEAGESGDVGVDEAEEAEEMGEDGPDTAPPTPDDEAKVDVGEDTADAYTEPWLDVGLQRPCAGAMGLREE